MASAGVDEAAAAAAAAQPRAAISHVIFDMDGLLLGTSFSPFLLCFLDSRRVPWRLDSLGFVLALIASGGAADTEGFYTEVQEKILARYGKVFDWSLKAKMMGKKAAESARIFVDECGLDGLLTPEQFLEERESMLQALFPSCTKLPGVLRLIHHLHANGIPMAVATGSHKRHFALKTQNHQEMFSLMHHVVMGDDPEVKAGKPSPDIFLAAMRRFEGNVEPSKCLVFEDAPSGVAAAKNAGMSAVMVPDPRLDVSYHKGADQVICSLLDFKPSEWGLPPFNE
ncbi:unnamed protein product [Urochloa decumbens]|uniref:glycerol-1-phosphatase n=1 Tax=Urochloa decumbens TaxID=240449 RepID=A0ABC9BEF4_9POAL